MTAPIDRTAINKIIYQFPLIVIGNGRSQVVHLSGSSSKNGMRADNVVNVAEVVGGKSEGPWDVELTVKRAIGATVRSVRRQGGQQPEIKLAPSQKGR